MKANRPASEAARPAIVKAALDRGTLAGGFGSGAGQINPNLIIDTDLGGFVPTEGGGTCR